MSIFKKIGRSLKKAVSWLTGIKEPEVNDFQQGTLVNKQSNVEPIPVIYGERRVGGVRVFVASSGANNNFLYMAIVFCEGEIQAITDILIDDKPTTDPKFAYTDSISFNSYLGSDSQTADPVFIAAGIGWTSNHRLRGLAYIAIRLKWNQDAFNGIPNITAVVQGKKCYDPRTTTTIYTQNPAIALRDYLVNTRYGKGLASGLIDDASFIAAANKCDAAVSKYTGAVGTEPIFKFNAIINTGETLFNNVKVFLASMRGIFPFSDGKYSLVVEDDYASTFAFTIENILSDINVTSIAKSQQYNRVTAKFTNPAANWQSDSVSWPLAGSTEASDFLTEDNNFELVGEINVPGTTDFYSARDLARIVCLDSRLAKLSVDFVSTTDALSCAVGDVVTLTHPSMGWTTKYFRVTDLILADTGEISVGLKEHVPSIYPWVTTSQAAAFAASTLPNPLTVAAPTALVIVESSILSRDGTVIREIDVSWTASNDLFVSGYEVQYKTAAAAEYLSVLTVQPRIVATYGEIGVTYNVRVRAINGIDVRSEFLVGTYTTVGDVTAPAIPTSVTIVGDYNQVTATWSAATEKDYKESWVYQNTTGTTPNLDPAISVPFRKVTGNTVTVSGLAPSTTYYVWVRNVDFSDNRSAFSSAGTFTTTAGITSTEIADNAVTTPKIDGSAVTDVKIATNAVTSDKINALAVTAAKVAAQAIETAKIADAAVEAGKIAANAVTTDKINALAVTAAKVAASAIETSKIADLAVETGKLANAAATEAKIATNAITETKISDNAITTPKLVAGAVTAAKITAATITANEIAAATITSAKIAAGTITAGNIAALTITASEIAANAITADKILANTITAAKIAAATITATEIAASTITGAKIAAGTITAGNIAALTITASEIAAGAVVSGKISADAVELNSLVSNTSKTYDSSNFAFEMGTSTSLSGYQGAGIFRTQKTTSFAIGGITTGSDSFAIGGQSTNNASAGYGGGFVNSTASGGTSHRSEVYLANSSQAGLFIHTASANNALLANSTYAIDTNGDVYVDGDITATGTITPFTGSHDGVLLNTIMPEAGDILVDTQIIARSGISEALARMAISSASNQPAIGVYTGNRVESYLPNSISEHGDPVHVAGNTYIPGKKVLRPEYETLLDDSRIIGVNSVGEGLINVCGENGSIAAGDLIVTSNSAGKGMKQTDDTVRSRTVAKSRESVTFDTPEQVKQIACIYLCG